jgi:transcriptional regulator with XRE-family HTH domain
MNIGTRITELREAKGLSTNALSKKAGVAQSHLREIENGNKKPGIEVLDKLCQGLGITLSDFFAVDDADDISLEMRRLVRAAKKLRPDQIELITKFIESINLND